MDELGKEDSPRADDQGVLLRRHLGALYSCPTSLLHFNGSRSDRISHNTQDKGQEATASSPGTSSSRCIIPVPTGPAESTSETNERHDDSGSADCAGVAVGATATANNNGAVLGCGEVFCCILHGSTNTRSTPAVVDNVCCAETGNIEDNHTLLETLTPMYAGLGAVHSSQPRVVPDLHHGKEPKVAEGDNNSSSSSHTQTAAGWRRLQEDAKQTTPGSTRRALGSLLPCRRLHAGLVPLLTPLVHSDDGTFLVRTNMQKAEQHLSIPYN